MSLLKQMKQRQIDEKKCAIIEWSYNHAGLNFCIGNLKKKIKYFISILFLFLKVLLSYITTPKQYISLNSVVVIKIANEKERGKLVFLGTNKECNEKLNRSCNNFLHIKNKSLDSL